MPDAAMIQMVPVLRVGRQRSQHRTRVLIEGGLVVIRAACGIDPLPAGFTETIGYVTCDDCLAVTSGGGMSDVELTEAERETLGRLVNIYEADDASLNEWHPCADCTCKSGPCPCSGRPYLSQPFAVAVGRILAARLSQEREQRDKAWREAADMLAFTLSEFASKNSAPMHTMAMDPRCPDFGDEWVAFCDAVRRLAEDGPR